MPLTPFRFTFQTFAAYRSHGVAYGREQIIQPEGRFVYENGPVKVLVENGKKLKQPKVLHAQIPHPLVADPSVHRRSLSQ